MKPKDLKCPFSWDTRNIILKDQVLYVPYYYDQYETFVFPGWEHPDVFGNDNPVCIEYCSGNGAWIAEKAAASPNKNWVAVEKKFDRVRKIWSKVKNKKLNNLFIISGEAYNATKCYIPSGSISEAFVNFPDPWPKDRHAKHRLIQLPFIQELESALKEEGTVTLVTDDVTYSGRMIDVLQQAPGFESSHPAPFYVTEYPGYGTSYFEELWREKGRNVHYHEFKKRNGNHR